MKKKKENQSTGCIIAFFILFIIIITPIVIGMISNTIKEHKEIKHEQQLISDGKNKSSKEIIDIIQDILKNRKEKELSNYLSKDFKYINDSGNESKNISYFWTDLKYYAGKIYVEQRGDTSNKEKATYWVYWDIPEKLEKSQYSDYCLQRIMIYMNRVVKENEITYEIEKIILKNN